MFEEVVVDKDAVDQSMGYAAKRENSLISRAGVKLIPVGKAKDLTGKKFGSWTVVGRAHAAKELNQAYWYCTCDCGKGHGIVSAQTLVDGRSASCGCSVIKHGLTNSPEYGVWESMKTRVTNAKSERYTRYGERGITICERWLNSFEAFYLDMGPRPSPEHSLDRKDVHGNYEPNNCRWATPQEQMNNTTRNHIIEFKGEKMTVAQYARRLGISPRAALMRIREAEKNGVELPDTPGSMVERNVVYRGQPRKLKDLIAEKGIPRAVISARLNRAGWSVDKTFDTPWAPVKRRG